MSLDPRENPLHLELARAILRGQSYDNREMGAVKILGFVLDPAGSDMWIGVEGIKLRSIGTRKVHGYFLDIAPGMVWDLLGRLGLARIESPTVGVLRSVGARVRLYPAPELLGWIVPTPDEIVIHTRPIGVAGECETGPIPDSGPWALPVVEAPVLDPAPRPLAPEFVELPEPLNCLHCGNSSSSYRRLSDGWFVCRSCARSFQPPQGQQRN